MFSSCSLQMYKWNFRVNNINCKAKFSDFQYIVIGVKDFKSQNTIDRKDTSCGSQILKKPLWEILDPQLSCTVNMY